MIRVLFVIKNDILHNFKAYEMEMSHMPFAVRNGGS